MTRLLMLQLFVCLAVAPVAAKGITIVKDGVPAAYIALPSDRTPSMRLGAEEIQRFIHEISGATVTIIDGNVPGDPKEQESLRRSASIIVYADSKLGEEEFRIRTERNSIVISGGGKRGALYGCYALLEEVLGVRWYNTRVTKVPKAATITVPTLNIRQKPAFEYREPFWTEAFDASWAARNRTNGNSQRLTDAQGGRMVYYPFVHTFSQLVPPDKYFAGHPEYFSMIGGKRVADKQLCLTNPDVLKIAVEQVKTWVREHPEATIFSVSQNDTDGNCQCPVCKAVETEEGAPSGVLLRFVNDVAEEVGKEYPNILIDTLAYQWSEKPPTLVKPRANVRIRIAPISACFGHGLDGCDANKSALANLKAWAKITDQLYVWHYCTNFANYLQPLPDLDELAADIPLFKKTGVVGLFYEGAYAPGGGGEMAELKAWLTAKLMLNPSLKAKPLISEYLDGVYGPAAPMVKEWLDLLHAGPRADRKMEVRIYDPPTAAYLADATLDKGIGLFNDAEKSAAGNPPVLEEVDRARLALEYVLCMRRGATYVPSGATEPIGKTLAAKIRLYGITQIREGEPVSEFLKRIGE
ncbi:MAG TPA: DUF4838 domain-containing protein [Armatimonadota bacterium]|jgi:hypothetical protein